MSVYLNIMVVRTALYCPKRSAKAMTNFVNLELNLGYSFRRLVYIFGLFGLKVSDLKNDGTHAELKEIFDDLLMQVGSI
jgi:hypothetical protein